MSTPGPTAKRRRIDNAANTLSKPFKSPFKTPLKPNPNIAKPSPLVQDYTPSTKAHTWPLPRREDASEPAQHPQTPSRPPPRTLPSSLSTSTLTDPELRSAQRTITALETQLRVLRTDIDTLTQATSIASRGTDAELIALITKWRCASRAAAEEVFAGVKDKVCRMGGVGAWREMERKKQGFGGGGWGEQEQDKKGAWGEEEQQADDDDSQMGDEEREVRREERERIRDELVERMDVEEVDGREEGVRGSAVEVEEGADDDTFTMDMMLRSLNIELDVIGYDREQQRWSE
ncbi:hypothetical protein BJ546DRAFT_856111 [Cryomyces antarcticus]|nr:hypothetical protein LTR60_003990 [Cryomyces antarcticus]